MSRSRHPRRRATLASLAAELNVSRTTVSNAYNRPDQLSPELRARVLAAAKQLGYPGPDPVARSLRTRRAGAVGLLLTEALSYSFRDPAAVGFVAGLAEACEEASQGLLIIPAVPGRDETEAAGIVQRAGVDGFVVYSVADDDPYLKAISERHLPVVICDQPFSVAGASRVGIDDRAAMRELAQHVIGLGHKRIGMLTMRLGRDRNDAVVPEARWQSPHFHVQRERIAGVTDAMSAAGIEPSSLLVVERFDHLIGSGYSAAEQALTLDPEITALICTTDVLAMGAISYATDQGLDVPGQLTVTGFDGVAEAIRRGITTVRQPGEEKGRRAGRLLNSQPNVPTVDILETEFVLGSTSGPVR